MIKVEFKISETETEEVQVRKGHSILRAAQQGRIGLRHKCGGKASCTTCKVMIDEQVNVSEILEKERRKLGEVNIEQNFRLSCQTQVYGNVTVKVPEDPYKARIRALLAEQRQKDQ